MGTAEHSGGSSPKAAEEQSRGSSPKAAAEEKSARLSSQKKTEEPRIMDRMLSKDEFLTLKVNMWRVKMSATILGCIIFFFWMISNSFVNDKKYWFNLPDFSCDSENMNSLPRRDDAALGIEFAFSSSNVQFGLSLQCYLKTFLIILCEILLLPAALQMIVTDVFLVMAWLYSKESTPFLPVAYDGVFGASHYKNKNKAKKRYSCSSWCWWLGNISSSIYCTALCMPLDAYTFALGHSYYKDICLFPMVVVFVIPSLFFSFGAMTFAYFIMMSEPAIERVMLNFIVIQLLFQLYIEVFQRFLKPRTNIGSFIAKFFGQRKMHPQFIRYNYSTPKHETFMLRYQRKEDWHGLGFPPPKGDEEPYIYTQYWNDYTDLLPPAKRPDYLV